MDSNLLIYDNPYLLKILVTAGANTKPTRLGQSTPLMKAVSREQYDLVRLLLVADPAALNEQNVHDETTLMLAVKSRNLDIIRLLLEHTDESMLTMKDRRGETALCHAIYTKDESVVKLLLDADVRKLTPTMKNAFGFTPVQAVRGFPNKEIVRMLISVVGENE